VHFPDVFALLAFNAFSQPLAPLRKVRPSSMPKVGFGATMALLLEIAATFRQNDRKRYRFDFVHSVHSV